MSPLTPANRSAAASVVHENHTIDDLALPDATNDQLMPDANNPPLPTTTIDTAPVSLAAGNAAMAASAPMDLGVSLDTMPTSAPDQNTFSNTALDMFQQSTMPSINLMMALAQLSASQISQMPPAPTVVTPAQVSLPNLMHDTGDQLLQGNGTHMSETAEPPAPLESFARIEFADSVFQMTTYAVIIGRDQRALQQARRDEKRVDEYQRKVDDNAAAGLPPPSPPSQERGKFSKSYVSEEGGMLGPESDGDGDPRPAKRRKVDGGSGSGNSQSQEAIAEEQAAADADKNVIANRQYVSHTPGAAAVDLASLRPSPYHIPFIGIHSPGPGIASKTKAISREHLKIEFNQEQGIFEAIPLHKNGFFCEDIHYKEEKAVLHSGDRLQIKDIEFAFMINGVAAGKTGAEEDAREDEKARRRYSEGGKEMSFDFESSHAGEVQSTSSDEEEDQLADLAMDESESELSDVGEVEMEDVHESQILETVETDNTPETPPVRQPQQQQQQPQGISLTLPPDQPQQQPEERIQEYQHELQQLQELQDQQIKDEQPMLDFDGLPMMPPKKRGPGRPPKNGIMSKREERLRKKMAMEIQKKTMPQPPPGEPPIKRKVGRPRKHPRPEDDPERPEKRKYKPRKPKGEDGAEVSDGAEKPPKEKRREKPKTPPLELKKEEFTEEQLQKPNKNYGVLIDEVLTAEAGDGLTLKQIYKRIQKRYPYYYFVVDTKGWESSVRHNLIGNDAFKKNEETHLWSRVPGIELDAGKKRKVPSPDQANVQLHHGFGQPYQQQMPHPGMYQQQHMVQQQAYQPNAMPPPGYPPNLNQPQQASSPPNPQYHGLQQLQQAVAPNQQQQQQPRPVYQVPPPAPVPAQNPGYGPSPPPRPVQLGVQGQQTSYSSPYAAKPPPAPAPPTNGVVGASTPPVQHAQQPSQPPQLPQMQQQPGAPAPQYNAQQRPQQYQPAAQMAVHAHTQAPGQPQPMQQPPFNQVPPRPLPPPQQPSVPLPPLEPPVKPDIVSFINNFKKNVMEHLSKRTDKAEAVTLSVINRGLGLTSISTVPEQEGIEKVVLGVFEQTRDKAYPTNVLNPGLVTVLKAFKTKWVDTLGEKLGKSKAEALLLSAIDRFLGFSQGTILAGSEKEKKEYEQAEDMLIPQLRVEVQGWQRQQAAGGSR